MRASALAGQASFLAVAQSCRTCRITGKHVSKIDIQPKLPFYPLFESLRHKPENKVIVISPSKKVTGSGLSLEPDFKLVETGESRTTFTPKIKTLAERHAFWVKFYQTEERIMPLAL